MRGQWGSSGGPMGETEGGERAVRCHFLLTYTSSCLASQHPGTVPAIGGTKESETESEPSAGLRLETAMPQTLREAKVQAPRAPKSCHQPPPVSDPGILVLAPVWPCLPAPSPPLHFPGYCSSLGPQEWLWRPLASLGIDGCSRPLGPGSRSGRRGRSGCLSAGGRGGKIQGLPVLFNTPGTLRAFLCSRVMGGCRQREANGDGERRREMQD